MISRRVPWSDAAGRFSPLKAGVLAAIVVPACWVALAYANDDLGARPINEALHEIGRWAIRFLFISLASTPLRQALVWPRAMLVRRMIGVAAFAYATLHLAIYTADQAFDLGKIASEIVLRIYLLIGFIAWIGLTALASTSTNAMVRRLGGRTWQRLHSLAYPLAILAVAHQFMQSKANVIEPMWMAGLLVWLLSWRVIAARHPGGRIPIWTTGLLVCGAATATALGEAFWFHVAVGVPVGRVLMANVDLATGLRPAWIVAGAGGAFSVAAGVRAVLRSARLRAQPRCQSAPNFDPQPGVGPWRRTDSALRN
jgi:sulfoxide reductase heme-binding subunit YedZ